MTEPLTERRASEPPMTQRESQLRWSHHNETHELLEKLLAGQKLSHEAEHETHEKAHAREHQQTAEALQKAEVSSNKALDTALTNHRGEHALYAKAIEVADVANEKRLYELNKAREMALDQAKTFVSAERVDTLVGALDRRMTDWQKVDADARAADLRASMERNEAIRTRLDAIEKLDIKGEGKSLGQTAVIALIVGAGGFIVTVLTIVILVANVATGAGP